MDKMTFIKVLCQRFPGLENKSSVIGEAAKALIDCYSKGGKLLICGNGGSSSDAEHVVGELMKSFGMKRPLESDKGRNLVKVEPARGEYLAQKLENGLPAVSLSSQTSLTTAIANDMGGDLIFAQQVVVYGNKGDLLLAISTSGNSQNILDACLTARAQGMKVIGLTGKTGGKMKQFCDILINVPEESTGYVQELHLPVLHAICLEVEHYFYGNQKT
jgi:phosphoheptose isomerase